MPTGTLGQTDIVGQAGAKVGDQWGSRKTASIPAAARGTRCQAGQQQSYRTLGAASPGMRNTHVPWGISQLSRTCRGSSGVLASTCPRRNSVARPARIRTRSGERPSGSLFRENRPQRSGQLAPLPATVSRCPERHPAQTSGAVTPTGFSCEMWRPPPASRSARAPQHSTTGTGWLCFSSRLPAARQSDMTSCAVRRHRTPAGGRPAWQLSPRPGQPSRPRRCFQHPPVAHQSRSITKN